MDKYNHLEPDEDGLSVIFRDRDGVEKDVNLTWDEAGRLLGALLNAVFAKANLRRAVKVVE